MDELVSTLDGVTDPSVLALIATTGIQQQLGADAYSAGLGIEQGQLALNYEELFAEREIGYRNLSKGYAVRGLGDSGYGQRARREFQEEAVRAERQINLNYDRAANNLYQNFRQNQFNAGLNLLGAAGSLPVGVSQSDVSGAFIQQGDYIGFIDPVTGEFIPLQVAGQQGTSSSSGGIQ